MRKTLYFLNPKIKWRAFKALNDKIVKNDIVALHADKILWQMLRDRQISCYFAGDIKDDMGICLFGYFPKRYKNYKIIEIK